MQDHTPWGIYGMALAREWPRYIVGSGLPAVDRGECHPVRCGVYFLFDDTDGLMYVGMSGDIWLRMSQHIWRGSDFAYYGAVEVPGTFMHPLEIAYIDALKPALNKKFDRPPFRDIHDQMVSAINELWVPIDAPT